MRTGMVREREVEERERRHVVRGQQSVAIPTDGCSAVQSGAVERGGAERRGEEARDVMYCKPCSMENNKWRNVQEEEAKLSQVELTEACERS